MRSDAGLRHDGVAAAAEGRHEAAAELLSVALGLMPGACACNARGADRHDLALGGKAKLVGE